jgi:hydrogenase/urease accessory protein HupE
MLVVLLQSPSQAHDAAGRGAPLLHGLQHGLGVPHGAGSLAWWAGVVLTAIAISGGTTLLLRRLAVPASLAASPQGIRRPSR